MKRVMAFLIMVFCFLNASANGEEKSWELAMKSDTQKRFAVEINLQAKTRMAMMFMPEQEIFFRLFVSKSFVMGPINASHTYEIETCVATATLENYVAGQPNSSMDESLIDSLLWTSGLGGKGQVLTATYEPSGKIVDLNGIPEKYTQYFQNDLVFFPTKPVKVGESWDRTFTQAIAIDPAQEPVKCEVKVVYTLKKVSEDGKIGEVAFEMETHSDYIMQNGQKTEAKMNLTRSGSMKFSMENCIPTTTKSKSTFEILFSAANYIKSEEYYDAKSTPIENP